MNPGIQHKFTIVLFAIQRLFDPMVENLRLVKQSANLSSIYQIAGGYDEYFWNMHSNDDDTEDFDTLAGQYRFTGYELFGNDGLLSVKQKRLLNYLRINPLNFFEAIQRASHYANGYCVRHFEYVLSDFYKFILSRKCDILVFLHKLQMLVLHECEVIGTSGHRDIGPNFNIEKAI
jgi:hypothetical protein